MSELEQAIQLRKEGKLDETLSILKNLIRKKDLKTNPVVLAEIGTAYFLLRELKKSEKFLKRSIENGNDPLAYAYLAMIEQERGNLDKAERLIDRAMRMDDDREIECLFIHGLIKLRSGKVEEAKSSFRDSFAEIKGEDVPTKIHSARLKLGHIINKSPPDWLKLGLLYEEFDRHHEACQLYRFYR